MSRSQGSLMGLPQTSMRNKAQSFSSCISHPTVMVPPFSFVGHFPNSFLSSCTCCYRRSLTDCMRTRLPGGDFDNDRLKRARSNPRRSRARIHREPVLARVAIVGTVPDSFQKAILAPGFQPSDISLQVARSQHKGYCAALSSTSISSLLQLPANPRYPDSIFVEDPVVVISDKTAFMAKAGHSSREGEGGAIEHHLEQLGIRVSKHPEVSLDGGDVLKMNEFILVGITERTERDAIPALQRVVNEDFHCNPLFETCPAVVGVPVEAGLHLKSLVTWVGGFGSDCEGFIVAPDTKPGRELIHRIETSTQEDWDVVWINEDEAHAANVLYIPPRPSDSTKDAGHVLVQETCPRAVNAIRTALEKYKSDLAKTVVIPVDTSEFGKANGALTCMSVII